MTKVIVHFFDGIKYNSEVCKVKRQVIDNPVLLFVKSKKFKTEILLVKKDYHLLNQNYFEHIEKISLKSKLKTFHNSIINNLKNFKQWTQKNFF